MIGRWQLLSIFVLSSSLVSIGKIYFNFVWAALLGDLLFLLLFFVSIQMISAKRAASILIPLLLAAIAVLQAFNPKLGDLNTALQGFRQTGLCIFAVLVPSALAARENNYRSYLVLIIFISLISSANAVRQHLLPFPQEISYAMSSGGAAKLLGDDFQGAPNTFRPFSTFVTSVHLALFLTLGLFAALAAPVGRWRFFLSGAIIIGIFSTLSRSAYVSALAGAIVWLGALTAANPRDILKYALGIIVFTLTFLAAISVSPLFSARVGTLISGSEVSSLQSRTELWAERAAQIAETPMGFGTGSSSWAFRDSLNLGSDSNYLKFFLELGWIGGLIFCLFCIWMAFRAVRLLYMSASPHRVMGGWSRALLVASSAFILSNLVQMITNQTLEANPNNFLFWLSCGFIIFHFNSSTGVARPLKNYE